jgi:(1->4)-alpha-D-glucan 1-alpha-D-glucosylmutase
MGVAPDTAMEEARESEVRDDQSPRVILSEVMEVVERESAGMRFPEATYRIQFHRDFKFTNARAIVPYLASLGISDCYASPYLKAAPGSSHGYDIVDHNSLNPEVGDAADYDALVGELHFHGMGQILDIVPNHMGIASGDNAWWFDVLENGPGSPYASFFDIDWMPLKPDLANKVLLPVLGDQYGRVLEDQQLTLVFEGGSFYVQYFDQRFPIAPHSWGMVLYHRLEELERQLGSETPPMLEYHSILTAISHLPPLTEATSEKINERRREKEVIQRRLTELTEASPDAAKFIQENVRIFNGVRGEPRSFDLLDRLLLDQSYRLSFWRVAADEINYRRFFDVNTMAAICMEHPEVLEKTHSLIFRLLKQGQINGLRIDHPDGLYDPADYFKRIQQLRFLQICRSAYCSSVAEDVSAESCGAAQGGTEIERRPSVAALNDPSLMEVPGFEAMVPEFMNQFAAIARTNSSSPMARPLYVVVEKILEAGETLPANWQVHGTTGYDFLNSLNGIFVDRSNARAFDRLYSRFCSAQPPYKEIVYRDSKLIMQASMSSEVSVLGHELDRISEQNRLSRDFTLNSLTEAIREVIACFPVYRTYVNANGVEDRDRLYIEIAVARAKRRNPATSRSIFDFVRDILLLHYPDGADEAARAAQRRFVGRFQQVTGPVMAKGVEDTAFYVYNRLVSLNEVGGDPERFGLTPTAFHQENMLRQAQWPNALLATSTHDTKRSEDVRARINVLSEIPKEWRSRLFRWTRLNQSKKTEIESELAPSRNDECLLYQTLVGTWPLESMDSAALSAYLERIQQYMTKATREAKSNTSWISPNEAYERAIHDFAAALLSKTSRNAFLADFEPFARRIADRGLWNSLSQTLLKLTCPGVPDVYQGTEIWNFSLVDPDNRRPVDYALRQNMLAELEARFDAPNGPAELARDLVERRNDGRIKLYLIWRLLNYRREHPGLCTAGTYLPIETAGGRKDHLFAFVRREQDSEILVAVPRLIIPLLGESAVPVGEEVWQDTRLVPPPGFQPGRYWNLLTGEKVEWSSDAPSTGLSATSIFQTFPVAVLERVDR